MHGLNPTSISNDTVNETVIKFLTHVLDVFSYNHMYDFVFKDKIMRSNIVLNTDSTCIQFIKVNNTPDNKQIGTTSSLRSGKKYNSKART